MKKFILTMFTIASFTTSIMAQNDSQPLEYYCGYQRS